MNDMILRPTNFSELVRFAEMAARSKMVPANYQNKPEDIMLAVQMGSEVGLAPMQAIQNIAVIGGRPSLWGDAMLALCKISASWVDIQETLENAGSEQMAACCKVTRKGQTPVVRTFSVVDAKKAGLWGKAGPWQGYPDRMLQMRARGFALRDTFPDVLRGLISAEEAQDMPRDTFGGMTIDAAPERPTAPPQADGKVNGNARPIVPTQHTEPVIETFLDAAAAALSGEANGSKWLKLLSRYVADAPTLDDLAAMHDLPSVITALEKAPTLIKEQIRDLFTAASQRLGTPSPDEGESEEVATADDGWPSPDPEKMKEEAAL